MQWPPSSLQCGPVCMTVCDSRSEMDYLVSTTFRIFISPKSYQPFRDQKDCFKTGLSPRPLKSLARGLC